MSTRNSDKKLLTLSIDREVINKARVRHILRLMLAFPNATTKDITEIVDATFTAENTLQYQQANKNLLETASYLKRENLKKLSSIELRIVEFAKTEYKDRVRLYDSSVCSMEHYQRLVRRTSRLREAFPLESINLINAITIFCFPTDLKEMNLRWSKILDKCITNTQSNSENKPNKIDSLVQKLINIDRQQRESYFSYIVIQGLIKENK